MRLTTHFTLEEMTYSEVATRLGLDNTPKPTALTNLSRVATLMEHIRVLLGHNAILVHSGYRSTEVNRAVGGVDTSAHCKGLACDFVCPKFGSAVDVALAIFRSNVDYDQLILEYGWVHLGLAPEGLVGRCEALTKRSPGATYEVGIRA